MAEHPHEEVRRLFDLVLDVPSGQRDSVLDRACDGDAGLKERILAMIAAAEDKRFLAAPTSIVPAGDGSGPMAATNTREEPGQRIDRYKLLQPIGEGGFGSVWMAAQKEPVKRRVALKIIKLGMDTRQVVARFEAERQALAMMDHPNIAKVLDAGATETGRPYFVMELVKGVPITEYCDTENLTTDERLELFISVCNAAQHAHQKGIIHRDIKPSNVLITLHDGKPVVKVIDFGIAKAIDRELTDKTLFTEFRQFIGTPEYMSPEQAEMSGLDIDTRSDIYSLGVLLYELLTGVTPFDPEKLRSAALNEIQRIIREEEPPRPSTRLSEASQAPVEAGEDRRSSIQSISRHRRTDPRSLTRTLRGDLDWIVMKAMEKDRARRYETANGFAMDVRRYLDDEPVLASQPSASYKLRKLVRRNKGAFTAAAAVFLALTLGIVGTTLGLLTASRANRDLVATNTKLDEALNDAEEQRNLAQQKETTALAEADRAERELARANAVKQLIADMFRGVSPEVAQGADLTLLRGILDESAARLVAGEVTDDLVAAELHRIIGNVYKSLGLFEDAERQLLSSMAKYERTHGPQHAQTRSSENALALLYADWQRFGDAEPILTETLRVATDEFGEANPFVLKTMTNLAMVYSGLGRYAEAEELYVKALKLKKQVLGPDDTDTLRCMNNLGSLFWSMQRYEDAEPLFIETLERRERTLGPEHPETLGSTMNLANLHRELGRFGPAESLYLRAIQKMHVVLGPEHPRTSLAMSCLGMLYLRQGRLELAERYQREATEARHARLGPDNEDTLGSMTSLGMIYNAMGKYDDAVALLEPNLATMEEALRSGHPFTRTTMHALADAYAGLGRADEAVALHRRIVDWNVARAEAPDASARTLNSVAWLLLTHGEPSLRDPARALDLAQRACRLEEEARGDRLWDYLDTLALAQHLEGDTPAAVGTQQRSLSLMPVGHDATNQRRRLAGYQAALAESETDRQKE